MDNFLEENKKILSKSKSINKSATFNASKLKSLNPIIPSVDNYNSKERDVIIKENLTPKQISSALPKVFLPHFNTLIKPSGKVDIKILENSKRTVNVKSGKSILFKVDLVNRILKFDNGKEYDINTLVSENSKTGKSIDKDDLIELANVYLNLNIPTKNKKNIFIKAVKEKIGIDTE
jgi:hypothetical protein